MKLTRNAFLYLDPVGTPGRFAQCVSCRDWVSGDRRCVIHGPKVTVPASASCGLYVYGQSQLAGARTRPIVTPEESGLVDREVRCENCRWFDRKDSECELYILLNKELPHVFDLETGVSAYGCCNANEP